MASPKECGVNPAPIDPGIGDDTDRRYAGGVDQLWVFDGDDTLWAVEPLYDQARSRAACIVAKAHLDPARWEERERALDVANVAVYGVSPERFPTSCVQAYEQEATERGKPILREVAEAVWAAAETVFRAVAPVHPDARRVVEAVRVQGPTVLLTKGDYGIQHKRIADSGLADAFDDVVVVAEKNERAFLSVLLKQGFDASASWSIGNSVRSDINPALRIGMHAVWVDAHVWEYERAEAVPLDGVQLVHDLRDVPLATTGVPLAIG